MINLNAWNVIKLSVNNVMVAPRIVPKIYVPTENIFQVIQVSVKYVTIYAKLVNHIQHSVLLAKLMG